VRTTSSEDSAAVVTDRYSSRIIFATGLRAKSAQDLSEQCGIPIAACYRRIKALEEIGVLECKERFLNRRGKWVRLYQSGVKGMDVSFEDGRMKVRMTFRSGKISLLEAASGSQGDGGDRAGYQL
jgi:predicted ArsR family transcriptional regulator